MDGLARSDPPGVGGELGGDLHLDVRAQVVENLKGNNLEKKKKNDLKLMCVRSIPLREGDSKRCTRHSKPVTGRNECVLRRPRLGNSGGGTLSEKLAEEYLASPVETVVQGDIRDVRAFMHRQHDLQRR